MKESKFLNVLKKYGYWLLLGVAVAFLICVIALSTSFAKHKQTVNIGGDDTSFVVTDPITFVCPVASINIVKDYSNSALQYSKTLKQWEAHKAIDFAADEGTDVLAVKNGTVTEVSYSYLMGNTVKLDVGNGLIVVYSSLQNDVKVKEGDKVKEGSVIGKVGNTAKSEASDGPHLHLETWLNNVNVDPNIYLDLENK